MSYCDTCLHHNVCGVEGVDDEGMTYCVDRLEPCKDTISRREAIKMFTYNYKGERIPDYDCDNFPVQIAIKKVKKMLRELSSVTPKQMAGHWIKDDITERSKSEYKYKCDRCGAYHRARYDYCPSCGAKMVEPQESEDKE